MAGEVDGARGGPSVSRSEGSGAVSDRVDADLGARDDLRSEVAAAPDEVADQVASEVVGDTDRFEATGPEGPPPESPGLRESVGEWALDTAIGYGQGALNTVLGAAELVNSGVNAALDVAGIDYRFSTDMQIPAENETQQAAQNAILAAEVAAGGYGLARNAPAIAAAIDRSVDAGRALFSSRRGVDGTPPLSPPGPDQSLDDWFRSHGRTVETNPLEGAPGAGRQGDRWVDGVLTEYKTLGRVADLTEDGLSKQISKRIMGGRGQSAHVVLDVRDQRGMTPAIAERGLRRAVGANEATAAQASRGPLQSMTIVGQDFVVRWP
jgi:hypothetical protein